MMPSDEIGRRIRGLRRDTLISDGFVQHDLNPPRLALGGAAPYVMDSKRQHLARLPRPQRSWRIGSPPLPVVQHLLDPWVVPSQDEDVDVLLIAYLMTDGQLDRPSACYPPTSLERGEDRGDFSHTGWPPRTPLRIARRQAVDPTTRARRVSLPIESDSPGYVDVRVAPKTASARSDATASRLDCLHSVELFDEPLRG